MDSIDRFKGVIPPLAGAKGNGNFVERQLARLTAVTIEPGSICITVLRASKEDFARMQQLAGKL